VAEWWVRLGADRGRLAALGVGNKAAMLGRFRRRVPVAVVVLHEAWEAALAGVLAVEEGDGQVTVTHASALMRFLSLPDLGRRVAVRSAFSLEDTSSTSLAGFFVSRLNVDPASPAAMGRALTDVWASARRTSGIQRRDVLVMAMVDAAHAGVAFLEEDYEDDLVEYTPGLADRLVSGEVAGERFALGRLLTGERKIIATRTEGPPESLDSPPFARRLARLLRSVRRCLGDQSWDVEWADDGRRCWLVQVRPITAAPQRSEVLSGANLREILPDVPSPFTIDSFVRTMRHGWNTWYRGLDPTLPEGRDLVVALHGRLWFNLSLLVDHNRHLGVPTKLVTEGVGGWEGFQVGWRPLRVARKVRVLLRHTRGQVRVRHTIQDAQTRVLEIANSAKAAPSFGACVEALEQIDAIGFPAATQAASSLAWPIAFLRRAGTLDEHSAGGRSPGTRMYLDLATLGDRVANDAESRAALAIGEVPSDTDFASEWQTWLSRYGHRGEWESDLATPRFAEDPGPILATLARGGYVPHPAPKRSVRGFLTLPVWWQARRSIAAREGFRNSGADAYWIIRRQMLSLAERAVASDLLPGVDAMWLMSFEELRALDRGRAPSRAALTARRSELKAASARQLPLTIRRHEEPGSDQADRRDRVTGIALSDGDVHGVAWVLLQPSMTLPSGHSPSDTVLVARTSSAGWIPTWGLVSGVVVEIGGDLSHGSIILRELAIPAITNANGATTVFRTGEGVHLRAAQGVAERIDLLRQPAVH
jgi:phosphohistidine swiveling domain-containing protein